MKREQLPPPCAAEQEQEDILKIATVNFCSYWGEKERNLRRIAGYVHTAARDGCQLVVFPEMCLTGYENEPEKPKKEKMQVRLAEPVPGPSTEQIADLARELGIYVIFGLPEQDGDDPDTVYNTVAVAGPEGYIGKYRKMHIPFDERTWSTPGDELLLWDTPWGKMAAAICYDVYAFPEIARIAAAGGARVYVNCTAHMDDAPVPNVRTELEDLSITNGLCVVTSNHAGPGIGCVYGGHSSIIVPASDQINARYCAGHPFYSEYGKEPGIYEGVVDLSLVRSMARLPLYRPNPFTGRPDFTPERYARWYQELSQSPAWREKGVKSCETQ